MRLNALISALALALSIIASVEMALSGAAAVRDRAERRRAARAWPS